MKQSILILTFLVIVIIVCILISKTKSEASMVESALDSKKYLVQNLPDNDEAAYILSVIYQRILMLKNFLQSNINSYPDYKIYIEQFCNRINRTTLTENAPNGKYTSYTLNKGDQIALCLRSKYNGKFHDLNLIMYVVIHELAHVACPEIDHTPLFEKIFIFLLQKSIEINIYVQKNYAINPREYCGIIINENLLDKN